MWKRMLGSLSIELGESPAGNSSRFLPSRCGYLGKWDEHPTYAIRNPKVPGLVRRPLLAAELAAEKVSSGCAP